MPQNIKNTVRFESSSAKEKPEHGKNG